MRFDGLAGVLLAAVIATVSAVALIKYMPSLTANQRTFVVLDVVRLNNAFRATAAPIIGGMGSAESSATAAELTLAGRRTREVVRLIADGRPVILAQALIEPAHYEDITDRVIEKLGLEPGAAVPYQELERSLESAQEGGRPVVKEGGDWAAKVVP